MRCNYRFASPLRLAALLLLVACATTMAKAADEKSGAADNSAQASQAGDAAKADSQKAKTGQAHQDHAQKGEPGQPELRDPAGNANKADTDNQARNQKKADADRQSDAKADQANQADRNERNQAQDRARSSADRGETRRSFDQDRPDASQRNDRPNANQDRRNREDMERQNRNDRDDAAERRDEGAQRREARFRPDRPSEEDRVDQDRQSRSQDRRSRGDRDNFSVRFGLFFSGDGLRLGRVTDGSFAARAGLRRGDEIVSINGHRVSSSDDFDRWFMDADRGDRVAVVVLRDGREQTLYVDQWGDYEGNQVRYDANVRENSNYRDDTAYLGVILNERYPNDALVQDVQPGSPAERAGLHRGDIILKVNNQPVDSAAHLSEIISRMQPGDEAQIQYSRRQKDDVAVELGSRPASPDRQDRRFSRDLPEDAQYDDQGVNDRRLRQDDMEFRGRFRGDNRDEGANIRIDERGAEARFQDNNAGGRLQMRREGTRMRLRDR